MLCTVAHKTTKMRSTDLSLIYITNGFNNHSICMQSRRTLKLNILKVIYRKGSSLTTLFSVGSRVFCETLIRPFSKHLEVLLKWVPRLLESKAVTHEILILILETYGENMTISIAIRRLNKGQKNRGILQRY